MTARIKLPDVEEKGTPKPKPKPKPKGRPTPDHVPRMEVELTPGPTTRADCSSRLRRIGEPDKGAG